MPNPRLAVSVPLVLGAFACGDPSAPSATPALSPHDAREPLAAVSVRFPDEDPGPPYYAMLEPLFLPHTDQWAAVAFLRDPTCVPDAFDLLTPGNPPAAFACALRVRGRATFRNGPPPVDLVPMHVRFTGLGAVPIWFVSWPDFQAALSDNEITVPELAGLPSLRIGYASLFEVTQHPGANRPQGAGNGKIEIVARGDLDGGGSFFFQVREMGIDQVSTFRHIVIDLE